MTRFLRHLAAGSAFAALLALLLEGVLALLSIAPERDSTPLARGFDRGAAYLVSDEASGGWRTQFQDGKLPEVVIPPRDGSRTRVLLFGGSNTHRMPTDHLRRALGPRYEVFNLGRQGYGSERVAILFEQALEHLEPDIAVVYSGHNEFVELGFRDELEREWSSGGLRGLAELAGELRTFRALEALFEGSSQAPPPEAWSGQHDAFLDLTYEETLEHLEEYANNLRLMCERARERHVELVLCSVVYNRWATPHVSTLDGPATSAERDRVRDRLLSVELLLPNRLRPLFIQHGDRRLRSHQWLPQGGAPVEADYSGLVARNPELEVPQGADPRVSRVLEAYDRVLQRRLEPEWRAPLEQAAGILRELLTDHPRHPRASFDLAAIEQALGRGERTRELLETAARFDRAPRKGNAVTNAHVRQVTEEFPGVRFLDVDAGFTQRAADGLVGWEWMLDHCHLGEPASRLVLELIAADLAR